MEKLLFVYNPNAGKGLIRAKIGEIIDIFIKAGYIPTTYATQESKDGYKLVKRIGKKYDLIVCGGGDGTLDEVVTAMMDKNITCPLGYIPTGSTNDFARSLNISRDILTAAKDAVSGRLFPCDVGEFNGDVFIYIAAFGMFTDVSYATPQDMKNVLGHVAYVLEGMKRIYNIPGHHMKITCDDGETFEGKYMFGMVTNSRTVGGFKTIVGKNVIFDDGVFEVTLIRKPKNLIELQEIVASILVEQIDSKHMDAFTAKKIVFECDEEVAWTLDGEFGGDHHKVEINNRNKVLAVHIPRKEALQYEGQEPEEIEWTDEMIEEYMKKHQIAYMESDS